MKPTKSRHFCPDCGRMKTVFDSEGAAKRFIEYNSEDIEKSGGYAPKRVYYCDLCCGWHVTSHIKHEQKSNYRKQVDAIMNLQRAQAELKKKRKAKPQKANVTPFLSEAMRLALSAIDYAMKKDVENAKEICTEINDLLNKMTLVPIIGAPKLRRNFKTVFEQLQSMLNQEMPPLKGDIERIARLFEEQREKHPGFYSYDPNVNTDLEFEVTPANIDEWIALPRFKVQEDGNQTNTIDKAHEEKLKYEEIQMIVEAAEASIAYGDFTEAKANLLEAIDETQKLQRKEYRDSLGTEIQHVFEMYESALKKI